MFEPTRGGTRGGQAEFKWSDVSADKDREHYLGHSINAPTGRWQKNKDVHWYSRDKGTSEDERIAEIRRIKQLEADALAVALGFEPAPKDADGESSSVNDQSTTQSGEQQALQKSKEKEEKHKRKEERKEEKRVKKLAKLERKAHERGENPDVYRRRLERDRSRSRSPRRIRHSRSRSPRRRSDNSDSPPDRVPHRLPRPEVKDYGAEDRERERERDRRRWDMNARRERPSSYR